MSIKSTQNKRYRFLATLSLIALLLGGLTLRNSNTFAANSDIIINEIQYNPNTGGNQNFEFIELYNRTSSPIDVSGWCFTSGISFCFPSGSSIAGQSYVVLSPNSIESLVYYQVYTVGTYSGNLSNGGETLTLTDDQSNIISSVSYTDQDPWPISPDGYGPSLELEDPSFDTALPESWSASNGLPTPGRVNSVFNQDGSPDISDLSILSNIESTDSPDVSVSAPTATSVNLYYLFDFQNEVSIQMKDDGLGADITASDGVWSASIPAHQAGKLVRYRVEATDGVGSSRLPNFNTEAMNYKGYAVKDPSQTSNLPIIQWFISDSTYDDLMQNHVSDDVYVDCVVVYGDQVFDNSSVKIKGEISLIYPKKSLKFKLPKTHKINIPGKTERPVNEFHMNAEWPDQTRARTWTLWQVAEEAGIETPSYFPTRVLRNNEYQGFFFFFEKYEIEYQQEKGLDTGLFAEDFGEIVSSTGSLQDMEAWRDTMLSQKSSQKREYVLEEHDIPNFINFMAFQAIINNYDWYSENNLFTYKATDGDNRWRLLPYDLDLALLQTDDQPAITPYFSRYFYTIEQRFQTTALYDELDIREMFFRRLRTLIDAYYSNDQLKAKYQQNVQFLSVEAAEDVSIWPTQFTLEGNTTNSSTYSQIISSLEKHKQNLLIRFAKEGAIPSSQPNNPSINIEEVNSNSAGTGQYIRLKNNNSYAVDISGWKIPDAYYQFKPGSVIPSGGSIYINRDDNIFKSNTTNTMVLGTFNSDIPLDGIMSLLRQDDTVSDSITYTIF